MVDLLGLSVAVMAILLSLYWWSQNQQKKAAETAAAVAASKRSEKKKKEEEDSKSKQSKSKGKPVSNGGNKPKKQPTKSKSKKASSHPRFLRRYGGHAGRLTAHAISPDGQWLATAGVDGKVRVNKVDEPGFNLSCTVSTDGTGVFQDHISALSWLPNDGSNPTIVGTIDRAREVAFYRIRHKKGETDAKKAAKDSSSQYELIELSKRRFDISSRIELGDRITHCLADQSHPNDCLILTKTEYDPKRPVGKYPNTIAWSGEDKKELSGINTTGPGVRLSPDGAFLTGGGGIGASEAKVYEVRRKKVKGAVEPVFDALPSKHVLTLIPSTTKSKVAGVTFCGESDILKEHRTQLGIAVCEDGTVEMWDLDVDFRNKEDPKFMSSVRLSTGESGYGGDGAPRVVSVAASVAVEDTGGALFRVAVATDDSALHVLSYRTKTSELALDFTIDESHRDEGVGELQFCPSSGNVLYSTGESNSRDVFSWKLT